MRQEVREKYPEARPSETLHSLCNPEGRRFSASVRHRIGRVFPARTLTRSRTEIVDIAQCDHHRYEAPILCQLRAMDPSEAMTHAFLAAKFSDVTHHQVSRVQALIRLGLTPEDVADAYNLIESRRQACRVSPPTYMSRLL